MLKLIVYENGCEKQVYTYSVDAKKAKELKTVLDSYLEGRQENTLPYIQVKKQDKTERIFLNQVRYFVSDRRKIKAMFGTSQKPLEFYMKMRDLEIQLKDAGFLRCHQSYLVNIHQILYLDGNNIVITGGDAIPISRKYKEAVFRSRRIND